jgi:hypothetical protein
MENRRDCRSRGTGEWPSEPMLWRIKSMLPASGVLQDCNRRVRNDAAQILFFTDEVDINVKTFMPRNQSFNRCLYAPLTLAPLICDSKFTFQGRCS